MAPTANLVIIRQWDVMYAARAIKIKVDGVVAGKVRNGTTVEIPVPAGDHVVQLALDWNRSAPLELTLTAGQRCELDAGMGPYLNAFIRPTRYLRLRRL